MKNIFRTTILKIAAPFKAEGEFEKAIEFSPESAISRYAYAQFLLGENEYDRAKEQIDIALKIDAEDIALETCKAWILTIMNDCKNAAPIYEKLITNQAGRHRKFRISTYDQAGVCYRKLASQYVFDGDYKEALYCFGKAIEIIVLAINDGDFDYTSLRKIGSTLIEIENYIKKTRDKTPLHNLTQSLAQASNCLLSQQKEVLADVLKSSPCINQNMDDEYVKILLAGLDVQKNEISGSSCVGVIDKIVESERGISYGFIKGDDAVRYFFHRSEVISHDFLELIQVGTVVKFNPSTNDKGDYAINIASYP